MIKEVDESEVTIKELNELFPINFDLAYINRKYYKDGNNKLYEVTFYAGKEAEIINNFLKNMELQQKKIRLLKAFGL